MGQRSITQKEIAERLGVSIATVSRALNDQPGVSSEVRERVLKLMSETGYSPDIRARSLVTSMTHTIAFVVRQPEPEAPEDPFYPIIMAGAQAYLSQHNYHILLATVDEQAMARPRDFGVVNQRRVDGLILAGPDISAGFILGQMASGIPLVLVDNCLSRTSLDCVLNDDEGGAYSATRRLVEYGHKRIAFLSGPQEWVSNRDRVRGYQRAVKEANQEALLLHGAETTIASGTEMMQQALERWPNVTALCAVNDAVAIGAIRAASRLGRRTPDDLSVIGFDDINWAAMNEPPLSTVHVFKRRMGELAAQRLLDAIQHPNTPPSKIIVSTKLVLRDSCCQQPRTSDPKDG